LDNEVEGSSEGGVPSTSPSDSEVEGSSEGGVPSASPSDNEVEGSSEGGVPSASPSDDMNVDIMRVPPTSNLDVGSRVIVDFKGKLYKATIFKHRVKSRKQEFQIHYDGNKNPTMRWIPVDCIKSTDVVEECNDDAIPIFRQNPVRTARGGSVASMRTSDEPRGSCQSM